jgi:hypothetical protein
LRPHPLASKRLSESISIQDALDIQNAAFMIPHAMTTIVQEGIEPMLIGTHLLQKIQYKTRMTTVFPAIEPLKADEASYGFLGPYTTSTSALSPSASP